MTKQAGSTGWLSSLFNMANGIVKAFGEESGVEADYLQFNSGAIATIGIAAKKTNLVVG